MRKALPLLAVLVLAAGCRPGGRGEESIRLPGDGASSYGGAGGAGRLSGRVSGIASELRGGRIEPDAALERAASILSRHVRPGCEAWPAWMEADVLFHSGWTEGSVDAVIVCTGSQGAFLRQARRSIERFPRTTHAGAARGAGLFRRAWVLLLGERHVRLEPFPRRMETGQARRLVFTLAEGMEKPRVYHLSSFEPVERLEVLEEGSPRRYGAEFSAASAGKHWIEVMASGAEGPRVLALFPVYVEAEPQRTVERPKQPEFEAKDEGAAERTLLKLVGRERSLRGLPPLEHDAALSRIARATAEEMRDAGRIAHRSPDGRGPAERVADAGYPARMLAENLSKEEGVLQAHEALMASPAHRSAMLDPRYTHVGIGAAVKETEGHRMLYVTQLFAVPQEPMDADELVLAVRERVHRHRAKLLLPGAVESVSLDAAAVELLGAEDIRGALSSALARQGVEGVAAANVQTVMDPDELVLPFAMSHRGPIRFGVAARVEPGERSLQAYEVALIVLK